MQRTINISRMLFAAYSVMLILFLCACGKHIRGISVESKKNISLFNGRDLSSFYSWLADSGHSDPDSVFTIVNNLDGAPAIHISGQHIGGLITKSGYRNYKLVAEYRWGTASWGTRKERARDAGILLHCQGEDGNNLKTFTSPWLRSVEYQMIEGGTGDMLLVSGFDRGSTKLIKPAITVSVLPGGTKWNEKGTDSIFDNNRVDCFYRDPAWKDVYGFRGEKDIEKAIGEWNLIEITSNEGNLVYYLNGVKVNEGKNGSFKEGKILLQSEYAEVFFRRVEIQPL